jgi:renalase
LTPRIAIIGAGQAGISCANELAARGVKPVIFEKSNRPGGRLATRRTPWGCSFDHGAQYLTAHKPGFQRLLDEAIRLGVARRWSPGVRNSPKATTENWVVGTPGMNMLARPFSRGLDIRYDTEVSAVERSTDGWLILSDDHRTGDVFDFVVGTIPSPQAGRLFMGIPGIKQAIAQVDMAACWSLMITFQQSADVGFDAQTPDTDAISWIARDSSKPDRRNIPDCWVVHASAAWSEKHLELDRDQVASRMIELLPRAFGCRLPEISHALAHRWRFARTIKPLGMPYVSNNDRTIFVGGDWCLGARVECAFDSGTAIARALPL